MLLHPARLTMVLSTLLTIALLAQEAGAVPIQIGNNPVSSGNIDGGTPTNLDRNAPMVLAAGTYTITDFNSAVTATDGTKGLVPFLVTGSPSNYTTIWVGPTFTPNTNGLQNLTYAPLAQTFTLLSPATVYAGANTINGPLLDYVGGGSTDHDGSPGFGPIALNQVLTGFSNPGLGRIYSFNLVVDLVPIPAPEPSSLTLLSLGILGVVTHRRRSNRQHQASN
jgi:hypothetical protein